MILLIDDDGYSLEFIADVFAKHGLNYRLKVFRDGGEALDYLFADVPGSDPPEAPKVIILDLRLPRVSGFEVLKMVRSNKKTRMTPVVVFTSSTDDRDRAESYRLGANSFIIKPFEYEQFVNVAVEIGRYWTSQNCPP